MNRMPTNHNHQPSPQAELTSQERGVLTVATLEEWRTRQHGVYQGLRESANTVDSQASVDPTFMQVLPDLLKDFLRSKGIDESSPNYQEIEDMFYSARIGDGNGDGIADDEWEFSPASRGTDANDTKSQRDVFGERITARLGSSQDTDPDAPDTADRPELTDELLAEAYVENARFDVTGARDKWASESAKRQGRAFSTKSKERDAIRDDYHQKVQALGIMELDGQISAADDETTKNTRVIEFLFDEQKKLRELTTEKLSDTKMSRFVEWMNAGSKLKRLGKAALIGAGAAAGAAVFGLIAVPAGVAAGVAGGVGAAAAGTARFIRGFARGDRHRGMGTAEDVLVDDDGNHWNPLDDTAHVNLEEKFSAAHGEYNQAFEEDTRKEQSKRRKAIGAGVLMTAVGTGAGLALSHAADLSDGWNNFWNGADDHVVPGHQPETGKWGAHNDFDGDGKLNGVDLDKDGDGVLNVDDYKPHDSTIWDAPQTPKLENPYFKWHIDANGVQQDNAADVFHDLLGYNKGHVTPEWLGQLADKAGVDWTPGHTLVFEGHLNDEANAQLKQMLEYAQQHNLKP